MSEIRDEIQDFHNRRKLNILKGFSDLDNVFEKSEKDELQKARHGRYADNVQNRKLQRVGEEYGQAAKQKEDSPGKQPKREEEETGDSKQSQGDNPIQNFAKKATDDQLKKYLEKNPNGEYAEVAKQELESRGGEKGSSIPKGWKKSDNDYTDFETEDGKYTMTEVAPGEYQVRDSDDNLIGEYDSPEEGFKSLENRGGDKEEDVEESKDSEDSKQPKEQREDLSGQLGDGEGFRNLNEELNDDNKTEVLSSIDDLGYNSEILMEALDGDFNKMLNMMKESDRNEVLSKIDGMKPVSRAELEETMKKMQGEGEDKPGRRDESSVEIIAESFGDKWGEFAKEEINSNRMTEFHDFLDEISHTEGLGSLEGLSTQRILSKFDEYTDGDE